MCVQRFESIILYIVAYPGSITSCGQRLGSISVRGMEHYCRDGIIQAVNAR